MLGYGAHVYEHGDLWRTARALLDTGAIVSPDGLRPLDQAVHGPDRPEVPAPLEAAELTAEGVASAEVAFAHQNVVQPSDGYLLSTKGNVWSDEKFPTWLGEEQRTLVLARRRDDRLEPWCDADFPERAWNLSEVRCSHWRLPSELPDQRAPDMRPSRPLGPGASGTMLFSARWLRTAKSPADCVMTRIAD